MIAFIIKSLIVNGMQLNSSHRSLFFEWHYYAFAIPPTRSSSDSMGFTMSEIIVNHFPNLKLGILIHFFTLKEAVKCVFQVLRGFSRETFPQSTLNTFKGGIPAVLIVTRRADCQSLFYWHLGLIYIKGFTQEEHTEL